MNSYCTQDFWKFFARLPIHVQKQADNAYKRFKLNPYHPSLRFKCISQQESIYSVRIGNSYRALANRDGETIIWYWIGSHEDYNHLVSQ